jgi:aspartate aminotransferase
MTELRSVTGFRPSAAAGRGADPERDAVLAVPSRADLVALHKGDPCFATPAHIGAAQREAVEQGFTHYPELRGDPELRELIAAHVSAGAPRDYAGDEVLVTAGGTQAIFCALTAYLDPGDEVLLLDPTFSLYAPVVRQTGAEPVMVGTTPDFRLDPDRLRAAITTRTKMIVINNPANPTGVVLTEAEVRLVADLAVAHRLLVLTDEVYDHLLFGTRHVRMIDIPEVAGQVLHVNSFSKTYAMTGWRLGYVVAPRPLLEPIAIVHSNLMSQVHWPTQRAGIAALAGPQQCVADMLAGYELRRAMMIEALKGIRGTRVLEPQGAFYTMLGFDPALGLTSAEVTAELLAAGVAVRSGTEYGRSGEGWLRLSFAADVPDIERGAAIVRTTLERLGEAAKA